MINLKTKHIVKLFIVLIGIILLTFYECNIVQATQTSNPIEPETMEPGENQYLELRATSITEIAGQGKQVIMELWGHNLAFKGFEVRFCYDKTKFQPSNIATNEETDDETEFFEFDTEFMTSMDMFTIPYEAAENVIRAVFSFDPKDPPDTYENLINSGIYVIDDGDGRPMLVTRRKLTTRKNEF